ncbi:GIY-YIG nuclease family protein [Bremerella cremea]|uniref:GIY-YIG nuclease family protein n=1 Tax=Bremerella cremea TaxID=1031537 RepID=UPI0031E71330
MYAFVCDGEIMYIGKTVQKLKTRMAGYAKPGAGQSTNIRNHHLIRELLSEDKAVEILVLPDSGLMHYGQFHLNLAAGLEDSLIEVIGPLWNGGRIRDLKVEQELEYVVEEPEKLIGRFPITLHPTYMRSGFFNVGVDHQMLLGQDGETIEFFLGDAEAPIMGTINRSANSNHTPRLMGGAGLRDWFQAEFAVGEEMVVEALSPRSVRLRKLLSAR